MRVVQGNARQRYLDHFLIELTLNRFFYEQTLAVHIMSLV